MWYNNIVNIPIKKTNLYLIHKYSIYNLTNKSKIHYSNILQIIKYKHINNYMKKYKPQNILRIHGLFRVDQWNQFGNKKQDIQEFVDQENKIKNNYFAKFNSRIQNYVEKVSARKDNRLQSIFQQHGEYQYSTSTGWYNGKDYTLIHRRKLNSKQEELVLDIMKYPWIKQFYKTAELVKTALSNDQKYLVFGFDLHNNEQLCFMVKNLASNTIVNLKNWPHNRLVGADNVLFHHNKGVFFTITDRRRPCKLMYQQFNSDPIQILYQPQMDFYLNLSLSKDNRFLVISSNSKDTSKVYLLNLQNEIKTQSLINVPTQQPNQQLYVNSIQNQLIYCRKNQTGNYVQSVDANSQQFKQLYRCKGSEIITDIDFFKGYVVLYIQNVTSPQLKIIDLINSEVKQIQLPYKFGKISPSCNLTVSADRVIFYLSTPFIYEECFQYNFQTKTVTLKEKFTYSGPKFNEKKYTIELLKAPSITGCHIPVTLIKAKKSATPNKLILCTYGFYGQSNELVYNHVYLEALEKGWTIAYPHVRGGGELGQQWHKAALGANRDRTWLDLEEVVGYLIKERYTHPNILFLYSTSAGAIAAWNLINRKPHLYKGVVLSRPFLDVLGTLLDDEQPINVSDYSQFGNPKKNKTDFMRIQGFSPYSTIQSKQYPFIYIIAGDNDYRCTLKQIGKFVKKFRTFALENPRYKPFGEKGIVVNVIQSGSHINTAGGTASGNRQICEIFGLLDYAVEKGSLDVSFK